MLAKRPIVLRFNELKELLGLPEEVEIYNVKGGNEEIEFTIVSKDVIEGLTVKVEQGHTLIRRIGINGLKQWKEEQGLNTVTINVEVNGKVNEQNAQKLAKEILEGLKKLEKGRGK